MKKFYVASRFSEKPRVISLIKELEKKGYKSVASWVSGPTISKPYIKESSEASGVAEKAIKDVNQCDIFILLSNSAGTGMYTELGVALGRVDSINPPYIFIVGEYGANSVFSHHPSVVWVEDERELISKL